MLGSYPPPLQAVQVWPVPATSVLPAEHDEQKRLLVAVGAVEGYWPAVHTVKGVQTRLLVLVGAVVWYCVELQTVSGVQPRLLVAVGAVV